MQSSLVETVTYQETIAGNQELILGLAQAQVLEIQGTFLPTMLEGEQSPDVGEEVHLSDEANSEGEPYVHMDYKL